MSLVPQQPEPNKLEVCLASAQYLRPLENTEDATLEITVTKNGEHFIAEVYDEYEQEEYEKDAYGNLKKDAMGNCKKIMVKKIRPPWSREAANFVPNRFKHGYKTISRQGIMHPIFQIPITDYSISLIQKAWTGKKKISDMAKPFIQKIFIRELKAEQNALRTARWRKDGTIPTSPWFDTHDEFLKSKGIQLNAYQKVATYNACNSTAYAYFADPGLGKTAMMIRKLDFVISTAEQNKAESMTLITCPKTIRTNWINEINKFSMFGKNGQDKIFIHTLQGVNDTDRAVNFLTALAQDEAQGKHVILISGFESFVKTPRLHDLEFDLCLMDESHNIANPNTKRTKTFLANTAKFHNKIIATGTPFRNSPFDIYTQLEFMGEGFSGFDSYTAFKEFFGMYVPANGYNGRMKLVDFQNIPLLQERLAKHAFIIRKEEALPHLPKKTFSIAECQMTKDQLRVYIQLAEQLAAEIESYGPEPDTITVNNILTQMLRLAQITSGFAATDNGTITRFDPNPKLELLVKILKGSEYMDEGENSSEEGSFEGILNDPNRKAIIWCCFKENLKMIHSRLALEGIKAVMFHGSTDGKDDVIDQYNCDPSTRAFIGIAASGGVGLNLVGFDPYNPDKYETNTTDTFNYSSNWSYVNRTQSLDRAHRYNTRVPQHITDLITANTIDYEIYNRLEAKKDMAMTMQDIRMVLNIMMKNMRSAA